MKKKLQSEQRYMIEEYLKSNIQKKSVSLSPLYVFIRANLERLQNILDKGEYDDNENVHNDKLLDGDVIYLNYLRDKLIKNNGEFYQPRIKIK